MSSESVLEMVLGMSAEEMLLKKYQDGADVYSLLKAMICKDAGLPIRIGVSTAPRKDTLDMTKAIAHVARTVPQLIDEEMLTFCASFHDVAFETVLHISRPSPEVCNNVLQRCMQRVPTPTVIRMLMEGGADINYVNNESGKTILENAVSTVNSSPPYVKSLLKLKADPWRGQVFQQISSWSKKSPGIAYEIIGLLYDHHVDWVSISTVGFLLKAPDMPTNGFFKLGCIELYTHILSFLVPYERFRGKPFNIYSFLKIKMKRDVSSSNDEQGLHKKQRICSQG